jgi:hypothetical protein
MVSLEQLDRSLIPLQVNLQVPEGWELWNALNISYHVAYTLTWDGTSASTNGLNPRVSYRHEDRMVALRELCRLLFRGARIVTDWNKLR